jgi:hypothetical protein
MVSKDVAREILGRNFLDVLTVASALARHNGPAKERLLSFSGQFDRLPFSGEKLDKARKSHLLVAVLPVSMNLIHGFAPDFFRSHHGGLWWRNKPFAAVSGKPAWWLIRKTPEPESLGRLWAEQKNLISGEKRIPDIRATAYAMVVNYLANGERMFERVCVRCSDAHAGSLLSIGCFNGDGIAIWGRTHDCYSPLLGLASAIKPNPPR